MTGASVRRSFRQGGWLAGHIAAMVIGVVLMIAGLALGVTMVLLPVGFGVGIAGLLVFVWGLFGPAGAGDL